MTATVNPETLTMNTALETCQPCPAGEKCAICQEMLTDAPPNYVGTAKSDKKAQHRNHISADNAADLDAVKTKVCGDAHFFHRICIMTWFKSASPNLNSCPIDRKVLFGTVLAKQPAVNLPTWAPFPGHAVEDHQPRAFMRRMLVHFEGEGYGPFPNYSNYDGVEELDHDVENSLHGRAYEDVTDLEPISARELGRLPAPRGRPFEDLADSELDPEFPINPDLTEIFGDEPSDRNRRQRLPLTPESLEHEFTDEEMDAEIADAEAEAPQFPFARLTDNDDE